jgi:hypothetical protein
MQFKQVGPTTYNSIGEVLYIRQAATTEPQWNQTTENPIWTEMIARHGRLEPFVLYAPSAERLEVEFQAWLAAQPLSPTIPPGHRDNHQPVSSMLDSI